MTPAIILGPPLTMFSLAWLIQTTALPEPWGAVTQAGAWGLMAYVLYKLIGRLMDEAREIRTSDRGELKELIENNTAQLARSTDVMERATKQLEVLDRTLQHLRDTKLCIYAESEAHSGMRRNPRHGD